MTNKELIKYLRYTFRMLSYREENKEELEQECQDFMDDIWNEMTQEQRDVANTIIGILDEELVSVL